MDTMADPEFTTEEIEAFHAECRSRVSCSSAQLALVLAKPCEELSYSDIRDLVSRVGWLSDDERKRFANVLTREQLTADELTKYELIYSKPHIFNRYFPATNDQDPR